ncbi:response regulator [Vallitalea okinawensis]|uniref:response regulator n=1 Tax=Vallitalea okinawensis TaxID=2078660 RepID=UPI000CFCE5D8|nr:response regulator [Vallitalea okinawensis]
MIEVLIVEDDPMVSEINQKFLERIDGFKASHVAHSLAQAKEYLSEKEPDLILLDVFFPQGKGLDLLKWIRQEGLKCDAILITADRHAKTVEEAFRYGAVDYLIKPFVFERFKEALLKYANRKTNLNQNEHVEQGMIDRYILQEKEHHFDPHDVGEMKGFNELTYKKIIDSIDGMEGNPFTAEDIAKEVGVSRITARRYLDFLEKENKLSIELEYGKVGRPKNKYRKR